MKHYLLFLVLSSFLNCCTSNKKEEPKPKTITIDPDTIRPGEIIHDSLSTTQIEKIKLIQKTFAEVYPVSLDEAITNFKRDLNPDKEIGIWQVMAATYKRYLKSRSKETTPDVKKEVFILILSRSTMPPDEAIKNSNLRILTNGDAEDILAYYNLEAQAGEK